MSFDLSTINNMAMAYDKQELDRLHSLWKKARKDAKRKQQELEATKRQRELLELQAQQQQQEDIMRNQHEVEALRAELANAHAREQQLREQRRVTRASIRQLTADLRMTQESLKTRDKELEAQMEKNTRLTSMIDSIVQQREAWLRNEVTLQSKVTHDLEDKEETIAQQKSTIALMTTKLQQLEVQLREESAKSERFAEMMKQTEGMLAEKTQAESKRLAEVTQSKEQVQRLEEEVRELQRALSAQYKKSEEVTSKSVKFQQQEAEMTQMRLRLAEMEAQKCTLCNTWQARIKALEGELQGFRYTNNRLIHLLASTPEHAEKFRPMAEATSQEDTFVFLPPSSDEVGRTYKSIIPELLDLEKQKDGPDTTTVDYVIQRKHESDYWIPSEVFRLTNQFLAQHLPNSRASLFYDFLLSINRVWKTKELRMVETAIAPYKREVQDLKRRLHLRIAPAVDVRAVRNDLELLKRNIESSKFRVIKGPQDTSSGGRALQTALEYLEALLNKLSFCQSEVEVLRNRLAVLSTDDPAVQDDAIFDANALGGSQRDSRVQDLLSRLRALCMDYERCLDSAVAYSTSDWTQVRTYIELQRDFLDSVKEELEKFCHDTPPPPPQDYYFYP